ALALLIVGAGALVSSSDDGGEEATDTTVDLSGPEITAPPSEEPIMPTMPSIPGFDPGGGIDPSARARPLADVLPELIAFVEETRGHEFVTDPVVEAVSDAEFEEIITADLAEEADDRATASVTLTALGHLSPGFDLEAATGELGASFAFGVYDPETGELYVKGDQITPFVQTVVVHELVHALDDQLFDLGQIDALAERPDETAFGFQSLAEGTASYVDEAFKEQLDPEDAAAYAAEELMRGFDQLPGAFVVPPIVLIGSRVPYGSGQRLVEDLVATGGMAEVDAAYDDPPITSEQVLEPDRFLAGEGAVALRPLEAPSGAEVAVEGAFGAVDLRLLDLLSDPASVLAEPVVGLLRPVPGYGGGRYVSWTEAGRSCISIEAVGDDASGSATIQELLEAWAEFTEAEVGSRVGGSGVDVITATRCG
ncbi:MAG TPA: hypothetical protein VF228_20605, partial [Iamia sp.]